MRSFLFLFCSFFLLGIGFGQSPFTATDAIEVQYLSSTRLNASGTHLAGIKQKPYRNRFGRDHFRFRDPSYITPFSGELLIIPTNGGSVISPFQTDAHIDNPTWSEDGRRLAFMKVENGRVQLWIYDLDQRQARQININTLKTIASGTELYWTDKDQSIILELHAEDWLKKGMELYREATEGPITVYDSRKPFLKWDAIGAHASRTIPAKVALRNGSVTELLPEGIYSSLNPNPEGDFLVFQETKPLKTSYNSRDGNEFSWKLLQWNNPADTTILFPASKKRRSYAFSRDQEWIAWADSGHVFVRRVLDTAIFNLTENQNRLSNEDTTKVQFNPVGWNANATQLIASSKYGLWRIDRTEGTVERFLEQDPEAENAPRYQVLAWPGTGRYLYLSYNATDRWERGISRFDFASGQLVELLKSDQLYRNWMVARDGSTICYTRSDGNQPDDYYAADGRLANQRRLTDLNSWTREKQFTRTELIKYLDADGEELFGILYYPTNYEAGKKYPLVCEIYEDFFDNGYRASMNIIANQGYFGFRPSVHLEEGRPGVAWVKGVTAGINKLIERGLVDPDKIGVHGTSYGGYAASLLISQTDRFAAAINISGKTNIISFLGDSPKIGTRNYAAAEVGQDRIGESLWEAPLTYIEHSAIMYADKMNTPHLLLTGEGDWNVPAANTRELYYALRRLGKEVVWVNYKKAGHGAGWAGDEETYLDQWKRMLDWYAQHFSEEETENQNK